MSVVQERTQETPVSAPARESGKGLTLRSFVVCVFALLLMGIWVQYEELINFYGGPFAENSPPSSAVSVILILLLISAILYRFRRSLALARPELVFVYTALLVAAPLMTQGMWHRFFGLVSAVPHYQDFKSYESLPSILWPHGDNLVAGPFDGKLLDFRHVGGGTLSWESLAWKGRKWKCPVLSNGDDPRANASLVVTINRPNAAGETVLVPGENHLFSCLVKATGLQTGSSYAVEMRADQGRWTAVVMNSGDTATSFALPAGFERVGKTPLAIPLDLRDTLTFRIAIKGPGSLAVQDVQFFNVEAVEGLYAGVHVVRNSRWKDLREYERNFTARKPDNMFSPAGLRYLMTGFIPLGQWARPALAWTILIGALFMGFFGLNVLMRKQWLEHERFSFPMNILPRELFAAGTREGRETYLPIFRNRVMWIGFGITMVLVLLKGLSYYYPGVPAPQWSEIRPDQYVTNPLLRAYLQNVSISVVFALLAIALLVETDILFSIWAAFLLFQLLFMFGKAFNWSQHPGYPWDWQQNIGAFIAYAGLAAFVGRKHLAQVFRQVFGKRVLDESEEAVSYRTAVLMILAALAIIVGWGIWTNMGALASVLFFGYLLVCGFAASKIRAEAGPPFGYWMPYWSMWLVAAIGGFAVFGSTGMLVATIAAGFMFVSCFLFIAPVQVEMLELGRRFNVRLKDIGAGLVLGLLGGLFIGGFALLCWAYGKGADNLATSWPYGQNWYFNPFRTGELAADRAFLAGTLGKTPESAPLDFIHNVDAKGVGIGVVVTLLLSSLRSVFMWFPLHPLGYVLATTYFARGFWFVCFLAWLIRVVIQRIGGAHTIRRGLVPCCVGMFLACMVSVMIFDVVGLFLRAQGVTDIYCKWP